MIQKGTILHVMDNSGAKKANCFQVYKAGNAAGVGDIIKVSIRTAFPDGKVKTGEKYKAMVVHTKSPIFRKGGDDLSFEDNAIVLLNEKGDPICTRVMGIVPREVSQKIRSLAKGVC